MLSRMIDRSTGCRGRGWWSGSTCPPTRRPTGTGSSSAPASARCACTIPASATTPWSPRTSRPSSPGTAAGCRSARRSGRGCRSSRPPADERMLDAWGRLSPFAGRQPARPLVSSARMLDALAHHQHQQRAHRLLLQPGGREGVAERDVPAALAADHPRACRTAPPRRPVATRVGHVLVARAGPRPTTQVRLSTGRPSSSSVPCTAQTTPPWRKVSVPSSSTVTSW